MRAGLLLLAVALAACRNEPRPLEQPPIDAVSTATTIPVEPATLCSAFGPAGITAGSWKRGVDGYACSSAELPVGARDAKTNGVSTVWVEVRGPDSLSAEVIVVGGDVRVAGADAAVREKLVQMTEVLFRKLNLTMDEEVRDAIQQDRSMARRMEQYSVQYASDIQAGIRENRLTIKRAT